MLHLYQSSTAIFMLTSLLNLLTACVKCTQHKGNVPKPAPILDYPPPEQPWKVVAIDLLQLPQLSGLQVPLVCVDHISRYVVLVPVKEKIASAIAHSLIANLICLYSTPRVLLSDNGKVSQRTYRRNLQVIFHKANLYGDISSRE